MKYEILAVFFTKKIDIKIILMEDSSKNEYFLFCFGNNIFIKCTIMTHRQSRSRCMSLHTNGTHSS